MGTVETAAGLLLPVATVMVDAVEYAFAAAAGLSLASAPAPPDVCCTGVIQMGVGFGSGTAGGYGGNCLLELDPPGIMCVPAVLISAVVTIAGGGGEKHERLEVAGLCVPISRLWI